MVESGDVSRGEPVNAIAAFCLPQMLGSCRMHSPKPVLRATTALGSKLPNAPSVSQFAHIFGKSLFTQNKIKTLMNQPFDGQLI